MMDGSVNYDPFSVDPLRHSAVSEAISQMTEAHNDDLKFVVPKTKMIKTKNAQQLALEKIRYAMNNREGDFVIILDVTEPITTLMDDDLLDAPPEAKFRGNVNKTSLVKSMV